MLRLASLDVARGIGVDNALALAASTGFERIELPAGDLPRDAAQLADLTGLLRELGLRLGAVALPWAALANVDPLEIGSRAERLGCHRLGVTVGVDVATDPAQSAGIGRALDGVGYRLAGRSASLTVRLESQDPEQRRDLLSRILRELSQSAVGLELDPLDEALFDPWQDRVHAIAVTDRMLLQPPAGSWGQETDSGERMLRWLGERPWLELVIAHQPGTLDEGDALTGARSRWRREIESSDRAGRRAMAGRRRAFQSKQSRAAVQEECIVACQFVDGGLAHVEEGTSTGGTDHA
jgi:sugar phosphate isomerase/epimerase